jgi:hypothetical protein
MVSTEKTKFNQSTLVVDKPSDWPQNNREALLTNILDSIERFIKEPTFQNKEIMLSLVTINDLNEGDSSGVYRFTEYEVGVINTIYFYAMRIQCHQIIIRLYELLMEIVITQKCVSMCLGGTFEETFGNNNSSKLFLPLRIFYSAYAYFRVEKDKLFSQQLLLTIKAMKEAFNKDIFRQLFPGFVNLIYDLSFNHNPRKFQVLNFERNEIDSLFSYIIQICNELGIDPNKRPFLGIFSIALANWILKSRNNYDSNFLYKCVSKNASFQSYKNHELWMKETRGLNDKREERGFKDLFINKTWMPFDWAKKTKIEANEDCYVSSFCKTEPDKIMRHKYGSDVFGYKNDRIGSLISPLYYEKENDIFPKFSLVMCYDILYSRDILKSELCFLQSLIDKFKINSKDKILLLSHLYPYWYLSLKDSKWEYEHERRYEIKMFPDSYSYIDSAFDEGFLKTKTSLFLYPDFINKDHSMHGTIEIERNKKLKCLASKDFVYCRDCLQSDFDSDVFGKETEHICSVCGSKNTFIMREKYFKK